MSDYCITEGRMPTGVACMIDDTGRHWHLRKVKHEHTAECDRMAMAALAAARRHINERLEAHR